MSLILYVRQVTSLDSTSGLLPSTSLYPSDGTPTSYSEVPIILGLTGVSSTGPALYPSDGVANSGLAPRQPNALTLSPDSPNVLTLIPN